MSSCELREEVRAGSRVGYKHESAVDKSYKSWCNYIQDVSIIVVVTFSGVTSGGMMTSGTTCCT